MICIITGITQGESPIEQVDSDDEEVPEITKWKSVIWLSILTAWISVLSECLVDAIMVIFSC